jgi:hypothetical protein
VREAVAFLLLACACGAAAWSGRPVAEPERQGTRDDVDDPAREERRGDGGSDKGPQEGGFAVLEARAAALAPGMRQVAERYETSGEHVELVRATGSDTCVRAAFAAAAPVVVRLVANDGAVLAETKVPATEGALGERGPVCVRKGDSVSAVTDGGGARVRWIAWASP